MGAIARFTGDGEEGASVLRQAGLSTIAIGGPLALDGQEGLWQMCVDGATEGRVVAAYVREQVQLKNPAVIAAEGEGYQSAGHAFQQSLDQALALSLPPTRPTGGNISQLATDLRTAHVDFVYYSGRAESGALFGQELRRGSDVSLLLGSDAASHAWQALLAPDANTHYVDPCSQSAPDNAGANTDTSAMPGTSENAKLAYDAAHNLLQAVAEAATKGKPDRLAVLSALDKTTSFDEQHVARGAMAVVH
jgi:ABC-type branched-subunit amino acid transport system substrate-binding protein